MATIEKRVGVRGTSYRAKVRIHGFPDQQKTFKTLSDAKAWAQTVEASVHKGEFQSIVKEAKKHTLNDVISRYREEILLHKSINTQRVEKTALNWWSSELGEYALSFIDSESISKRIRKLTQSGDSRVKGEGPQKPKAPKTIKHYQNQLDLLFKHARQWGWIGSNPVDGVNKVKKINNSRVRYLDENERKRLLDACKASPNSQLYPIVIFALSTGARQGEILKLTLNDIDLDRGVAILRDTKNGETRSIPILGHLNNILRDHYEWLEVFYSSTNHSKKWLFPRKDAQAPIDIRKAWENARGKAQVEDFRFHDLRHSAASYLAMNGASLLEIASVLGHKTLQMVKRYSHLSDSHTSSIVEKMNSKIFVNN